MEVEDAPEYHDLTEPVSLLWSESGRNARSGRNTFDRLSACDGVIT